MAKRSGHFVQNDEPDLVVSKLNKLLWITNFNSHDNYKRSIKFSLIELI